MEDDRIPPHDLDAEEAVLGSMLIDAECVPLVMDLLRANDFYRDKNMWVFMACLRLWKRRESVNQITVSHELDQFGHLEPVGGSAYLSNLLLNVPTSVHAEYYAKVVKKAATMREIIKAGCNIADLGYGKDEDPQATINQAVSILLKLSSTSGAGGYRQMSEIASDLFDETGDLFSRERITGMTTGYRRLDRSIGGFAKGLFYVIAGRPGMGKTTLMCEMARSIASGGIRVGIVSLEMMRNEIGQKMACAIAGLNEYQLRCSLLDNSLTAFEEDECRGAYQEALAVINDLPIFVDEDPKQTSWQIEARALTLKQRKDVGIIFVDHLSLAADRVGKGQNDVQRIDQITQNFKMMAKVVDIPVVSLCQLNRNLEYREDKRPRLSDLRASGGIEQNADVILGLYSPSQYDQDCDDPNLLQVLHLKNRKGLAGSGFGVSLDFERGTGRITDKGE